MSVVAEPPYYSRSSLPARLPYRWPDGARLALGFIVSMETWEMAPPGDSFMPPNVPGAFGSGPYPDIGTFSRRAYGNRVGVFRVMRALEEHGLKATAAIDAQTAQSCPRLIEECRRLNWEVAAHGIASTRVISSLMNEAEEAAFVQESIAAIRRETGAVPRGWHGSEHGESASTLPLLASNGISYVLDWPLDEQPVTMNTLAGPIVALPMSLELDDVYAHWQRRLSMGDWRDSVIEAVDELVMTPAEQGRMLLLNLHPWLMGHPYRISYLKEVLEHLRGHTGLWRATAGEIYDWHTLQQPQMTKVGV